MKKNFIFPFLILSFLWNIRVHAQLASCNTSGILAKWDFNTPEIACNGAINLPSGSPATPRFQGNKYFYCPNTNAGCGVALLGSKGHLNTNFFTRAICLANFWSSDFAENNKFAPYWDPTSPNWDYEHPINFYVQYKMPAGKTSCLNSFSLQLVKKQFDGTHVPFEKQGLAVKRNGVLIYSQVQTILPSHINVNPMIFNLTGSEFCSDGSSEVTYELIFGLIHRYEDKEATGYDNITINGTCGSPPFNATASSATCTATGAANNGKLMLSNFKSADRYHYTIGNTYSGTAAFATATPIPADGFIATTLPNPAIPQNYTIRVFNSEGCYADATVLLLPALCVEGCLQPSGETITVQAATCNGVNANSDASIPLSGVTNADKVGISTGSTYTGGNYAAATSLTLSAYTFSGLTNPTGNRMYTLRLYNGSDNCYIDRNIELSETPCAPCASATSEIKSVGAADPNSTPNNQVAGEDDQAVLTICRGTQQIDLELNQVVSPAIGQTCPTNTLFTWTLTLQNTGNLPATNLQIGSILPNGLYLSEATASIGHYTINGGWLLDQLNAGQTATLVLKTLATQAGTFTNCAEILKAFPENDPDSTPNNGSTSEDDDACASITVTGNAAPSVKAELSPENSKPNVPIRLTLKINNPANTPILLTADFVDNLPALPSQMRIAPTPNLNSTIIGVIAIANDVKMTIPAGTRLLPGLNQVLVDVQVSNSGRYCHGMGSGALQTTACANVEPDTTCIFVDSKYVMSPQVEKSFNPMVVNLGQASQLTLTLTNRMPQNFTLLEPFRDYLPTGLILATGSNTGTCGGIVSFSEGDTALTVAAGTVLSSGSCTIVVPVKSNQTGVYCNTIYMNALLGLMGTSMIGNEDLATSCLTVKNTPCTSLANPTIQKSNLGAIAPGDTLILTATVTGLNDFTRFHWNSTGGKFLNTGSNPTYWIAPQVSGNYSFTVQLDNDATGYGSCPNSASANQAVVGNACPMICLPVSVVRN